MGLLYGSMLIPAKAQAEVPTYKLEAPTEINAKTPADFAQKIYIYILGIAGTLAVVMIIYGGINYLLNPGNTSKQSDALDIIKSAIWGIVLLAGAYIILNTINPELTQLKNPGLEPLSPYVAPTSTPSGGGVGGGIGNCPGAECVSLFSVVNECKNGCDADKRIYDMLSKITNDSNSGFTKQNIRVTEAYPPSSAHSDSRHSNGCAIDITLKNTKDPICTAVIKFLSAASRAGFRVLNEYSSCGGVETKYGTGNHIHLGGCY